MNPNTVTTDGACPSCGQPVDPPDADPADDLAEDDVSAPWHFWVMIAGVVLYLGWRLVEAIIWGADRLF